MKQLLSLILACALVFALASCGSQPETEPQEIAPSSSSAVEDAPTETEAPVLFDSDSVVNDFLIAYNEISDFPAVEIQQGNIRTKAIVDASGLYMVVTHAKGIGAPDHISVEISGIYDEKLTGAFSSALCAVCEDFADDEILSAIDEIANHLYDIDYSSTGIENVYEVHGVQMMYIKDMHNDEAGRFELWAEIG